MALPFQMIRRRCNSILSSGSAIVSIVQQLLVVVCCSRLDRQFRSLACEAISGLCSGTAAGEVQWIFWDDYLAMTSLAMNSLKMTVNMQRNAVGSMTCQIQQLVCRLCCVIAGTRHAYAVSAAMR
jgi:hypothetical protein